MCDLITNGTSDSEVHRIARHIDSIFEEYFDAPCIPITYDYLVEIDRETSWDAPANELGLRQFSYQECSQLGWFHSSDSRFQPFGSSFGHEWLYTACSDVFGEP